MSSDKELSPPPPKRPRLNSDSDTETLTGAGEANVPCGRRVLLEENQPCCSRTLCSPSASVSFEAAKDFLSEKLNVIEETMAESDIPKPMSFEKRRKLSGKEVLAELSESFSIEENEDAPAAKKRKVEILNNSDSNLLLNPHNRIFENAENSENNSTSLSPESADGVDTDFYYALIRYALSGTRLLFIEKPQIWKQFKADNAKIFPKLNDLSVINIFKIFETQILPYVFTYKMTSAECRVLNLCSLNPNYRRAGNGFVKTGFKAGF